MNLIGQKIKKMPLGEGTITDCSVRSDRLYQIAVKFQSLESSFIIDHNFANFFTFYDDSIQKEMSEYLRNVSIPEPPKKSTTKISSIDKAELNNVMKDYIKDFIRKKDLSCVVKDSIPVIWFGDIDSYFSSPQKVLTIAINPSKAEFPDDKKRFDIIDFEQGNIDENIEKLKNTLNKYFTRNPYAKWFSQYEGLLKSVDASYYKNQSNTAIHIDIYSAIATDPTWGGLTENQKSQISNISLFTSLFELLSPDIVLISVNQGVMFDVFYSWKSIVPITPVGKGGKISAYKKNDSLMILGHNFGGTPFGRAKVYEYKDAIKDIITKHSEN